MAFSRFVPNKANLQKILDSATRKAVTPRAVKALSVAKSRAGSEIAPDLRYTVDGTLHQNTVARVGGNPPEVLYAEEGTRPHIIRAKNGKALKFPGSRGYGGKTVHTAVVFHPGTKGKHFLRDAARRGY